MDVADSDAVNSGGGGDCKDETVEKLLCTKNLNGVISYLTPNARQVLTQLRKTFTKAPIL